MKWARSIQGSHTTSQVARILKLKRREVLKLIHEGPMVAHRDGRRLMVEHAEVEKFSSLLAKR